MVCPFPQGVFVFSSPCEYKVCPVSICGAAVPETLRIRGAYVLTPKRGRLMPSVLRGSLLVRCTSSPSPATDSVVISLVSLVFPFLTGKENARKPAGAVGKSRSSGAAKPGLPLPRPCRQGPPACPSLNAPAPGRPGTAASATLPGPAPPAAADADGS